MSDPRITDCPTCPHCQSPCGIPVRFVDWNHRADPDKGHNLACPACGMGWEGTPAEEEQAEVAQLAWNARLRAESWNERSGWYEALRHEQRGSP